VKDDYFLNQRTPILAQNKVVSEDEYGAVEHSGSSVYYFAEGNTVNIRRSVICRRPRLMSFFTSLSRINIKTDMTNKLNMRAKMQTDESNQWIYEGFTEYFSPASSCSTA
jgi:predicted metalloprotease with PDZ domain